MDFQFILLIKNSRTKNMRFNFKRFIQAVRMTLLIFSMTKFSVTVGIGFAIVVMYFLLSENT